MSEEKSAQWKETGFLVLLALLCIAVTALQFRWTGDLADAELERLERNLLEGVEALTTAFDRELAAQCTELMPDSSEVFRNPEQALASRVRQWRESDPLPWFRRIGLVTPEEDGLRLLQVNPGTGAAEETEWPAEWMDLYEEFLVHAAGPGGPSQDSSDGWILELPLMDKPNRREPGGNPPYRQGGGPGGPRGGNPDRRGPDGPGSRSWLVLELDRDFVTTQLFPSLVSKFIPPMNQEGYRLRVLSKSGETLFSQGSGTDSNPPLSRPFHRLGRDGSNVPGPPGPAAWSLRITRETGTLEQMVAQSRRRNLLLAGAANALILIAGTTLVRQTRRSRLLARARMDFVSSVSHELRTPVAVILGAAHNLRKGIVKDPQRVERYAGMIGQHAGQLSQMVDEILEFSAAENSRTVYAKDRLSPGRILERALALVETEIAGMECEKILAEPLPEIVGDESALARAVANLLRNASKHAASGKWIGLRAFQRDDHLVIEVSDRGPGIPRHEQKSIFQPFARGTEAREKQIRGSGIGLGLVRTIVAAHRGKISVANRRDGGAAFTLTLPIAKPERP